MKSKLKLQKTKGYCAEEPTIHNIYEIDNREF